MRHQQEIDRLIRDIEAVQSELADLRERDIEAGIAEKQRLSWEIQSRKEELRLMRSVLMGYYSQDDDDFSGNPDLHEVSGGYDQ